MPSASRKTDGPRRGLPRDLAASYIGVSISKFDQLVKEGRAPGPKMIDHKPVWDVRVLDNYFDELPDRERNVPGLDGRDINEWEDE